MIRKHTNEAMLDSYCMAFDKSTFDFGEVALRSLYIFVPRFVPQPK